MNTEQIANIVQQSMAVKQSILQNPALLTTIQQAGFALVNAFKNKHRVWLCGNGGSAADAQHIAAELSGRFYHNRPPLPAEALHVNSSFLTAVANDYGYEHVFTRMVQGFAQKDDVLIGITTSGKSVNVLKALQAAQQAGVFTIGLCGQYVNQLKPCCNLVISVPSGNTPRIQEAHILIGHILCELTERELFSLIT